MDDGRFGDSVENWPDSMKNAFRKALAGRIPEIQEVVDDHTVYCEPCDREVDFTPSVLFVHNIRRHEELMEDSQSASKEDRQ